ncbi:MAG: NAD(P)-dependent oxidoreductase [Elusimicrobia bacterium]|nr:NAD(P)-dependent oxidoreductase [Elusimicrobiota bacterium]
MRIGITGANGQVGSEVCLLLQAVPGIELVPVVRNPSGSAFLRRHGLECRHGRIAQADEAQRLIGDCDVIANFALSTSGRPSLDREMNRRITRNLVEAAKPGARLVFFSTIMVYAPNTTFGLIPDAYGIEKLLNERFFKKLCRATRHQAYILRLGHVLGELQNITQHIRRELKAGPVMLPGGGYRGSNTVFTAAIAEALVRIAHGEVPAGTFDLVSCPQWSWRDLYLHYAEQLHIPADIRSGEESSRSKLAVPSALLRGLMGHLSQNQYLRERLSFLLGLLPDKVNRKVQIRYLQSRAFKEIAALAQREDRIVALDWRGLDVRPVPGLGSTQDSLHRFTFPVLDAGPRLFLEAKS